RPRDHRAEQGPPHSVAARRLLDIDRPLDAVAIGGARPERRGVGVAGETAVDRGDQPRLGVAPHRREPAVNLVPRRRVKLEGRRAVQHLAPVQGGDVAEVLRTGVADGWGHRSVLAAPSRTVSGFAPGVCYSAALLGEVESVRMILTAAVAACLVTPAPAPAV